MAANARWSAIGYPNWPDVAVISEFLTSADRLGNQLLQE